MADWKRSEVESAWRHFVAVGDSGDWSAWADLHSEDGVWIDSGENDNAIVQTLTRTPGSLGVFGYSFLEENGDKVPDDVTISVLTQAREDLIERTTQSLVGVHHANIHLYNALAPLFRKVVFRAGRDEVKDIAVRGTELFMKYAETNLGRTVIGYEYSPEIFTSTELPFSHVSAVSPRSGTVAAIDATRPAPRAGRRGADRRDCGAIRPLRSSSRARPGRKPQSHIPAKARRHCAGKGSGFSKGSPS